MSELLTKSEANIYILGYEDGKFIDNLLETKKIGVVFLPNKKTQKIIYKKDIDKFLDSLPRYEG